MLSNQKSEIAYLDRQGGLIANLKSKKSNQLDKNNLCPT